MSRAASIQTSARDALRLSVGTLRFTTMFTFLSVSVTAFLDRTGEAVLDPSAGNSNRVNQILALLLFFGMLGYSLRHPMRKTILHLQSSAVLAAASVSLKRNRVAHA
ncbi:hypothetical protein PYH37_000243 [Sinorhizobium numidicum]|uniref:Uncharacterized protein n=1 Tax=Sinorhizobium numidicum TaxID=680248 RepID=A0ABY8CQI2_9HYPH|nr:hypothetical protein [Sinorhizobium numidicum]WEX74931.1 hypothetical protein PYH37_000243 [Sinorhizobium numidicum]WEX80924.1 hypothetical protein PYH38_000245 [Sinorhizobium numidicum]